MTQTELASASGLKQPTISNIENGEQNASAEQREQLGTAFGCAWLTDGEQWLPIFESDTYRVLSLDDITM
jgi:transcriptional regulator with XRE-family HTH domain